MTPEWILDAELRQLLDAPSASLEEEESRALAGRLDVLPTPEVEVARASLARWDHLVIRNLGVDGRALLRVARAFGGEFKPYGGTKVVKRFRMSPWTRALSHTTRGGHFHTDVNTAPTPPSLTLIQCVAPDPGAPAFGRLFVTRLTDLLAELRRRSDHRTLAFLTDEDVTMVNDTSQHSWRGRIVQGATIRFHPVTVRDGQQRCQDNPADMEDRLAAVHEASLAVAHHVDLSQGDALVVSNTRAMHRRGPCTVRFLDAPTKYETREVHVLHLMDEFR